jgi:hypothetical protein
MKRVVFAKQSPAAGTKSACPSWASFDLEYAVDDVLGPESKIIDDLDTPVGRISNLSSQLQNGGGSIVFLLRNVKILSYGSAGKSTKRKGSGSKSGSDFYYGPPREGLGVYCTV